VRIVIFAICFAGIVFGGFSANRAYRFRDHLSQARIATMEGRISLAVAHLRACESIDSDDRRLMILQSRVARMSQHWPRAEEALEQYWANYGDDDSLAFERLLLNAARDGVDPALGVLNARIAAGGDSSRLGRHALVSGYIREFRYGEAQAELRAWGQAFPGDPLQVLLRGKLQEQLLDHQGAIELYSDLVLRNPDHLEARLRLAILLMQQREAAQALGHLQILRGGMADNTEVAVQWALALRQVGRTDEAIRALDDVLAKNPDSAMALTERAALSLNAGDDAAAAELLAKSLKSEPGSIGTRNMLVLALTRLGRTDDVKRELATIQSLMADSDRLTELTQGALQNRPDDPASPFEIGGIALRAGQPSEAIRWYQTALKRDPNHGPSHTALAVIYLEIGNPVLATRHRALAASAGPRR